MYYSIIQSIVKSETFYDFYIYVHVCVCVHVCFWRSSVSVCVCVCVCVYINEAGKGRVRLHWVQTAVKRGLANPPPYVLGAFHTTTEPDFRPP